MTTARYLKSYFIAAFSMSTKYFFIDRTGWEFPKYLEMLKQFDIYKAEEDYLNLKLEEPVEFGDFPVTYL